MARKYFKTDWLGMESELRELILDAHEFEDVEIFALCLDEIVAKYTRRGNELTTSDEIYDKLKNQYPTVFDWTMGGKYKE